MPVEDSVAAMNKAAADNALLMSTSMSVSTSIQGAASTTHTVTAANAAGTELAKAVGSDMRTASRPS